MAEVLKLGGKGCGGRLKNSREKERLFFAQEFRKIVIGILRTTMKWSRKWSLNNCFVRILQV